MTIATRTPGFYGTDSETYYLAPSGRAWIVASDDDLGTDDPSEVGSIPAPAIPVGDLMTPDEAIGHIRRIEAISGETLVEEG